MAEKWATVPETAGYYQASDSGRIRSVDRVIPMSNGVTRRTRGQLIQPSLSTHGYHYVTLRGAAHEPRRKVFVHALVLSAFVGPRPSGAVTRHLNGNPTDNRLTNLCWGTQSENLRDRIRHGTDPQAAKTVCPQGHSYDEHNTYLRLTGSYRSRECRACNRAAAARYRDRKKAVVALFWGAVAAVVVTASQWVPAVAHAETPGQHVNVCYLLRTGSRVADIEYRLVADGYTRENAGALAGRMLRDHCPDQIDNVAKQVGYE